MGQKINFGVSSLYHSLLHFYSTSREVESLLLDAEYTSEQIDRQLSDAGSKFFSDFASSPQDVVDAIERQTQRSILDQGVWDADGRCRLSFALDRNIGVVNVVKISELTAQERSSIREIYRGEILTRVATSERTFPTNLCQIIVGGEAQSPELITLFPGALTPPLPTTDYMSDPFWSQHTFIKDK
ncbi:MAG: hypothetical protein R3Y44_07780 [Rikenellaceae bacterium]